MQSAGSVSYFWFDNSGANPITYPDGELMFEVCFEIIGEFGEMSDVEISNVGNASIEFTNASGPVPFFTQCAKVTAESKDCDFTISSGNIEAEPGTNACIPVTASCFENILSFQYSMNWDETLMTFTGIENLNGDLPLFFPGNLSFIDPDAVTCSWNSPNGLGVDYPDGTHLFDICFDISTSCQEGDVLAFDFTNEPAEIEVTNGDADVIESEFNGSTITCGPGGGCNMVVSLTPTDALCAGESTGSVEVNVTDGMGPFSCTWEDGDGNPVGNTNCELLAVSAGTYCVTIQDSKGCEDEACTTVGGPDNPLMITASSATDATCVEGGTVSVTASGGTGDYEYTWNPALLPNGCCHSDVSPGIYGVTITDENECTVNTSLEVGADGAITLNGFKTDKTCDGLGSIDITVLGSSNVSIDWKDVPSSPNTEDRFGLEAGEYTVCVSENTTGCTAIATFEIFDLVDPISIDNVATTNIDCDNLSGGSIVLTCSGGCPTTEFSCTVNGEPVDCNSIDGLPVGEHTVCKSEVGNPGNEDCQMFTISSDIVELTINDLNITNVACAGSGLSGTITPDFSGGCEPFVCTLNNEPVPCDEIIDAPIGDHTFCVTDGTGMDCTMFSITESDPIEITGMIIPNGAGMSGVDITVSGGTADYTFIWRDAAGVEVGMMEDLDMVDPACYTVEVTDANNCIATMEFCIDENITVTNVSVISEADNNGFGVSCFGECDGVVTADVMGGLSPLTITLTGGPQGTVTSSVFPIDSLCAGEYTMIITGSGPGESDPIMFTVTSPEIITLGVDTIICESEEGALDGSILVDVAGGVTPYFYDWSPEGPDGPINTGLEAGIYSLQVTDENGCEALLSNMEVCSGIPPEQCNYEGLTVMTPNNDGMNDVFILDCALVGTHTSSQLDFYDRYGRKVFGVVDYDNTWNGVDENGDALIEGSYYWVYQANFPNGESRLFKGTTTILRD